MLGKIIKVEFFGEQVLGVVLTEKDLGINDTYCYIARSTLTATEENIDKLKRKSFKELLELSASTRNGSHLEVVTDHNEGENIRKVTAEYQEKYESVKITDFVEIAINEAKEMDDLHRFVFLDIANEKGIHNVVYNFVTAS